MKALLFHQYGGPEVLKIEDLPVPTPGPGEVLIRVSGSGINPVDWKIREGEMKDAMPLQFPHVVGQEFSGTIEKLGDGVTGYEVGDNVYGIERRGTCADYIVSNPSTFSKAPATMDLPDAGGVPLAGMTAWQGLFDYGELESGKRVLIHAGTGGVGTFAVQLAKWKGAYIFATTSSDHLNIAKELGADEVIDYQAQKFEDIATELDLVLDLVGGETGKRSIACLKPGGILVSTLHDAPEELAQAEGKRTSNFIMQPSPQQLEELSSLIQDLQVRPVIDSVVPLISAIKAHIEVQKGHTLGKMVIDVRK